MTLTTLHITGALTGLVALTAGSIAFGGVAQAASDAAGTVGTQVMTAVSAAQTGAAVSGRVQGARLAVAAPDATASHRTTRGSTPAPGTDRREIRRAVKHSQLTSAVDPDDYRVNTIRLSRTNPAWAAAMIRPTIPLDQAAVLAHRVHGQWKVVTLGTAQVGCGEAPRAVLRDFTVDSHVDGYESIGSCQ